MTFFTDPGPQQELRTNPRHRVHTTIGVRQRGRTAVVAHMRDLSNTGCRVYGAIVPGVGTPVWIRLPGLESRSGKIVWVSEGDAGIAFDERLHPAVTIRFTDNASSAICQEPQGSPLPTNLADPFLSRREQVLAGQMTDHVGPLVQKKRPTHSGLSGAIVRNYSRRVDHRFEKRVAGHETDGPSTVRIGSTEVVIGNVSPSGVMVTLPSTGLTIGCEVVLNFDGFPPVGGRIAWMRGDLAGIALETDALELAN